MISFCQPPSTWPARILRHSPLAAARIITAVTRGIYATISEGLQIESEQFGRMVCDERYP